MPIGTDKCECRRAETRHVSLSNDRGTDELVREYSERDKSRREHHNTPPHDDDVLYPLRGDFEKYFHFVILFARRRKKLVVKLGLDIPQMLESVVICIFYGILCKSFVFKTWKREEDKK